MAEAHNDPAHNDPPDDAGEDHLFIEQVTRFFNGPFEAGDLEALQERLRTDPPARRLFVQIATIDGLMTERSLENRHGLSITANLLEESADTDASQLSMHDATVLVAIREEDVGNEEAEESITLPAPVAESNESASAVTPILFAPWVIKISAAAAMVLIGTLIGFWVLRSSHRQTIANSSPPASPAAAVTDAPQLPSAICLGAAVRAQWDSDYASPALGAAIPDTPLYLQAGWVRLDFPSGVTAIVEAPARFQVRSGSKVTLDLGRIAADVPPLGHGFSIESPTCRVVDLGTDFGMSVSEQGQSEVQVFKGKVSFSRTESPADGPAEILTEGNGRRVSSQDSPAVATAADPKSFVRLDQFNRWVTASAAGLNDWRVFNEQLSRDPGLMLFYTMDDPDQRILKNHAVSTLGQYDFAANDEHGPTWVTGRMTGISALNFDASKKQYLVLPTCPITQTGQISGAVWINVRSYVAFGSIIKNWGNAKSGAFHLGFGGITHDMEIELDGAHPGGPTLRDRHAVPTGQWTHVAFVSDGTTARLYRDGKEVASGPSRPIDGDPPMKCLSIGCKTDDDGASPAPGTSVGFWDGQIGEIALFNRVLSPDEISRMSELGRP